MLTVEKTKIKKSRLQMANLKKETNLSQFLIVQVDFKL